jgi:hypothetical protein
MGKHYPVRALGRSGVFSRARPCGARHGSSDPAPAAAGCPRTCRPGLLPDRDVRVAVGRQRRPPPAGPALAQAQAGHDVEFGRPDVAEGLGEALEPPSTASKRWERRGPGWPRRSHRCPAGEGVAVAIPSLNSAPTSPRTRLILLWQWAGRTRARLQIGGPEGRGNLRGCVRSELVAGPYASHATAVPPFRLQPLAPVFR